MNICEWMEAHRNPETFKCSCGATVTMRIWVENFMIGMSARCWKCNKEMEYHESRFLVDYANFDMVDNLIKYFKRQFNSDEKPKPIRVVK